MKIIILIFTFISFSAYANKSRPGYQKNSSIVKELLRQEKRVRESKPIESRFDSKTKDYLRRKAINMKVTLQEFRSYVFKYKNDSSIRDYLAIMSLFTISSSSNKNIKERKAVEEILGLVIRLDNKEGVKFNLTPKDVLKAVEEWSMSEIFELRDFLVEVESKTQNGLAERDAFLSMFGNSKEQIQKACK